jgi:septation ring formation regulator EzrA
LIREYEMPPTTRSSLRFEPTPDGGWRILEGSSARKMTSEELNEFARQLNEASRELEEAEVKLAKITAEKDKAEKKLKRMDEAMCRSEEEMREINLLCFPYDLVHMTLCDRHFMLCI